jgi:hypothetical protein
MDVTADLLSLHGVSAPQHTQQDSTFQHLVQHIPIAILSNDTDSKLLPLLRHDPNLLAQQHLQPINFEEYDINIKQGQTLLINQKITEAKAKAQEKKKTVPEKKAAPAKKKRSAAEPATGAEAVRKKKKKEQTGSV